MLIVFEGIDGGGKTTLSNLVAGALAKSGLRVEHVRENGRYPSRVAECLREVSRDVRNLALVPEAELLLMAAREAQVLAESTRPALSRADVVIADRFFYTAEVLASRARGLDLARVRGILGGITGGLKPDLVFLVDADPHLARARRRVSKITARGNGTPERSPSRKGLAGAGLQRLLREGYRALAAEDPTPWIVVQNDEESLPEIAARLTELVLVARRHGTPAAARAAAVAVQARAPKPIADPREAAERFLSWVDRRAAREPAVAAYFLAGMQGPEIDARRRRLAPHAPAVIAEGLTGLCDAASWELRMALADAVPHHVARSLKGDAALEEGAWVLRDRLAAIAPAEVADSLAGLDDRRAWSLRGILSFAAPARVVASLARLDDSRAWQWRERWRARHGEEPAGAAALCESIRGLDGDSAWAMREAALPVCPIEAIESLVRLTSAKAWSWRERFATQAARPVMRTLHRLDDPRAWALRDALAPRCKEAVDSISGLDGEPAWALRLALADRWPSTVVKSLGPLAATPRGAALLARQLAAHPGDVSLLKHAASLVLAAPADAIAAIP